MTITYFHNSIANATQNLLTPGSLLVEEGALIAPTTGNGFNLSSGPWTITLKGSVDAVDGIAMRLASSTESKNSRITLGTEATLYGSGSVEIGLESQQAVDVLNSGVISGDDLGINILSSLTASKGFTITNNASGLIESNQFGIGNANVSLLMTVKNAGTITGGTAAIIYVGAAHITNSGTINGHVQVSGATTLTSTLTNSGTVAGNVIFGNGDDILKNSGHISGLVDLGNGNNQLTSSGLIDGLLNAGAGNDVVKNTGTIGGTIDLGQGNDSFTGGAKAETVNDNAGTDSYKLGAGNDVFNDKSLGSFTLDGGAGFDMFNAASSGSALSINLGTKTVTLNGTDLQAQTASNANATGGKTLGFEFVAGTASADRIAGGSAAESLFGNGGDDFIAGGIGADTMTGNAGADTFVYLSLKDSGPTRATRDTIVDFVHGTDKIDLHAIDANSKAAGVQSFSFIGPDIVFFSTAQLRSFQEAGNTIILGDVNGDGKADFSIALVGAVTLDSNDFIL